MPKFNINLDLFEFVDFFLEELHRETISLIAYCFMLIESHNKKEHDVTQNCDFFNKQRSVFHICIELKSCSHANFYPLAFIFRHWCYLYGAFITFFGRDDITNYLSHPNFASYVKSLITPVLMFHKFIYVEIYSRIHCINFDDLHVISRW